MIKNYFKTVWRNLSKHKLFTFINIFGLASGMVVCMMALIKIKEAYDYDNFHPNANKTYRVITDLKRKNGEHFLCASSPVPLSSFLKENYGIVEKSTNILFSRDEVTVNDKKLQVKAAYVNEDFYRIFGFELSAGTAAIKPQTVAVTSETAERFFGKVNPVGQVVSINAINFIVTGILKKPAYPSHLKFELIVSMAGMPVMRTNEVNDWKDEAAAYTYIQLKDDVPGKLLNTVL